jgi:hypothetical protein
MPLHTARNAALGITRGAAMAVVRIAKRFIDHAL